MDHSIAEAAAKDAGVRLDDFIRIVDEAVAYANWGAKELNSPKASGLAALYGIARFGAFVGRGKNDSDREAYIAEMTERYNSMLRAHFTDPAFK